MTSSVQDRAAQENARLLSVFGLAAENPGAFDGSWIETTGERIESINPATGAAIAAVTMATAEEYDQVARATVEAFHEWRTWPAPKRGEVVRQLGDALRKHKDDLGRLVSLEVGKVLSEGLGEVQEMID
ncbi:MAG: aldehyde dehydrogenase family protein, partial [Acidobacteria bacterium]|nr:aldehyde dehydrogenase family protein [Acidobacteriota bacterium]